MKRIKLKKKMLKYSKHCKACIKHLNIRVPRKIELNKMGSIIPTMSINHYPRNGQRGDLDPTLLKSYHP